MVPQQMIKAVSHLLLVLGMTGCLAGCSARETTRTKPNGNGSAPVQTAPASPRSAASIGFASREKLVEHYHKHGREFGNISIEEYLQTAQSLRDHAPGTDIVEAVRTDGVITRFDRGTGVFLAFNSDGVIRTCFKPNDGEAYFRRQLKRGD